MIMNKRKKKYAPSRKTDMTEHEGSAALLIKYCICGALLSFSAVLVILSISAVYALTRTNPEGFLLPIAGVLPYPCAMLGAFITCRLYRQKPLLCAVIYGLFTVVLSLVLYALLPQSYTGTVSALSFFMLKILLLLCCAAGSMLGAKSLETQNRRHRKRRSR